MANDSLEHDGKAQPSALIGYSGFVGSALLRQARFEALYRSTNVQEIEGKAFDLVVCAGVPAQKWVANREPMADRENIGRLCGHLDKLRCRKFVLISTVDVFTNPVGPDEGTLPDPSGLHPYGRHRLELEGFVRDRFAGALVVRLPGLVGPGLRKNVIYDFLHSNNLQAIESRSVFQFYPMVCLWADIQIALRHELGLIHLSAAPIQVSEVSLQGFGRPFKNETSGVPVRYDFRSRHAALFGSESSYQYSVRESVLAIRAYAQSEVPSKPT